MTKSRNAWIAPSLLSADFSKLGQEVQEIEKAGADWIHVDVMDGHFVPNLTIGPMIVESIRPITSLPIDCHLMVTHPENWIGPFVKAGANRITVHVEENPHLNRTIHQIQELGCQAGVAINPSTPVSQLEEVIEWVDLVLVMSVNPGWGGQKFIESSVKKIEKIVKLRGNRKFLIQVDGGVTPQNLAELRQAGADVFVAGSALFGQKDRKKAVQGFREILEGKKK